jgi:hypothetical protein
MKYSGIASPFASSSQSIPLSSISAKSKFRNWPLLILVFAIALSPALTRASNLILNPSFEVNQGQTIPTSWTYFTAPNVPASTKDYWIVNPAVDSCSPHFPAQSGTYVWKQWFIHNGTNNVAGLYQNFGSSPGSIYQASGWFATKSCDLLGADCALWAQVEFLDANTNLVALYKSDNFTAAVGTDTFFQYQVTNVCDLTQPVSVGDPYFTSYAVTGSVSQLVAPSGTVTVRYRFCYLTSGNEGGSVAFDGAVLNQVSGPVPPAISNLFPDNAIFVNPNDGLSFTVTSPSGFTINNSAIRLTLNGSNVSSGLSISGSASSKNVSYHGFLSNMTYTASITATDSASFTVSANTYFETTWVGIPPLVYLWEAEDWDFTNGMYINNPALCSTPGNPNCYFGKVGVAEVDEHNASSPAGKLYRPDDLMGTIGSGDYTRKDHWLAGAQDYRIDPFNGGEWLNYTRDFTNGTYWIVGRLTTGEGLSGSLTLSIVNPDTSTTDLGTFTISSGRGWGVFDNVFLRDSSNNLVNVTLNGKQTLRVTSQGNLLPGFFALAIAQVDLPRLSNLYPAGSRPFEFTNALSFTVTTTGATFPANGIKVILDGSDVSSGLVITGSGSSNNVVYPHLQPNATHFALITATNSLGHGISVSNQFDTFTQNNYMFEAEDFDYDGGQYVDPWTPYYSYSGLGATTNIDFQHTTEGGEQFQYRSDGIPESLVQNYPIEARDVFLQNSAFDFQLDWFGGGDWANYTRNFPPGNYSAYVRSAGIGNFAMYLDQVVSGARTPNQTTKRLGQWSAPGKGQGNYQWVELTDAGAVAPSVVHLGGVSTLRITTPTGLCYPNYVMLVPASGLTLSATRSGNNISISFPTQNGAGYRVFYRDDLTSGNWSLLTTLTGDGTTKSVTDPTTATHRFYKVTSP